MKILKTVPQFFQKFVSLFEQPRSKCIFDMLVLSAIVGVSFFLFDPNLDATWWVIDDHEIMSFTPAGYQFNFSEIIPTLLSKTEINPGSTIARFRPVYYFLRLFETRLWAQSGARGWYFARILIFIYFISTLYILFRKMNGRIIGFLLITYVTTFTYLKDIFTRLGPSEAYAILGFGISLIGVLIFIQKSESIFAWLCMMLGVVISIGSKENMGIFIFPFIFCFVYYLTKKPEKKIVPWISLIITISFTIWIYVTIYHRIQVNEVDIYQNSISITERLNLLISYIGDHLLNSIILVVFFFISFLGMMFARVSSIKTQFSWSFWCAAYIIVLFVTQVVFYSGKLWGRYCFPFSLYIPFTICLIVHFFQQLSLTWNKKIYYYLFSIITVLGMCILIKPAQWQEIREASKENVNRTNYFMDNLKSIKLYLKEYPHAALILYGNDPNSDYETSISYARFLRSDLIENDIYILREPAEDLEVTTDDLSLNLDQRIIDLSENGSEFYGISPLRNFTDSPVKCLLVNLRTDHDASLKCEDTIDGDLFIRYVGLYGRKK